MAASDRTIAFPFSQQHIADALGLSLVHTNKTFRRLQCLGMCALQNGRLCLLEIGAIELMADYYQKPMRKIPLI